MTGNHNNRRKVVNNLAVREMPKLYSLGRSVRRGYAMVSLQRQKWSIKATGSMREAIGSFSFLDLVFSDYKKYPYLVE